MYVRAANLAQCSVSLLYPYCILIVSLQYPVISLLYLVQYPVILCSLCLIAYYILSNPCYIFEVNHSANRQGISQKGVEARGTAQQRKRRPATPGPGDERRSGTLGPWDPGTKCRAERESQTHPPGGVATGGMSRRTVGGATRGRFRGAVGAVGERDERSPCGRDGVEAAPSRVAASTRGHKRGQACACVRRGASRQRT